MRELKFRGWSFDDKRWMNPWKIEVWDATGILKAFYGGNYVIEQWTGIKDLNGKDIYEGDIIKNKFYRFGEVFFDNQKARWWVMVINPLNSFSGGTMAMQMCGGKVEIVGNIHENPELLDSTLKKG